ncbi:uncharacterized protein LOC122656117 [Telopea speciosissima]|uniref:uncharacterized protein LOC122656117 n=1 Tax=Telopea speciosissima TaxID=54955 RepID=UPI001CC3B1F7|nr:uncharacterized protein LOC122656117 [Telopea speciosissima]
MTRSMAMASSTFSSICFTYSYLMEHHHLLLTPMFIALSLVSLCVFSLFMFKRLKRTEEEEEEEEEATAAAEVSAQNPHSIITYSPPNTTDKAHQTHPLILEILSSDPSKWDSFLPSHLSLNDTGKIGVSQLSDVPKLDNDGGDSIAQDLMKTGDQRGKKKKKRAKKKHQNSPADNGAEDGRLQSKISIAQDKNDLDCLYPFTSLSSVTQRKIKQQYDQLVKAHDSQSLTLAQVYHFANCLIEARNELQHKSEIIQRKFTITKALLFKADRSSFDRLCQQVYKLEAEQKRLEEDAVVYNRLQLQLKLSPAFKKMLEISSRMELKAAADQLVESRDTEFADISFEELLAQEKKDAFWHRNGKLRSCTS